LWLQKTPLPECGRNRALRGNRGKLYSEAKIIKFGLEDANTTSAATIAALSEAMNILTVNLLP
jgi:hypothetical protein